MCFLFQKGCKVSKDKLQYCQEKVVFLGHCFSATGKYLAERKLAIQNMPLFRQWPSWYSCRDPGAATVSSLLLGPTTKAQAFRKKVHITPHRR
ncbi:hypothetical protein GDO81_006019 [Engystomops pustulosus]|uniref:Uncharacterized protein n=1 Tax=Engystomops pustulosus TaxID=76066 RepID=A0AAV7CTX4_ENGPU|nr:hypothetical protein GDO81_006019 [Engystomops pustulosus]